MLGTIGWRKRACAVDIQFTRCDLHTFCSARCAIRYLDRGSTCFSAYKLGGLSSLNSVRERGESCPIRCNLPLNFQDSNRRCAFSY